MKKRHPSRTPCSPAPEVIVVAEEVGWDVVPVSASARLFRDVLGRMKQRLAGAADEAYLVVSGFVLDLRALGARGGGAS